MHVEGSKPLDHARQEAFCIGRAQGMTQKAAAIAAGYSAKTADQTGSRLEKQNYKTKKRLEYLKMSAGNMEMTLEGARQDMIDMGGPDLMNGITSKWLCLEFFKNCVQARAKGDYKDANNALVYIAKLYKKMEADIPFPPGSPHPIQRVDNQHRVDHNYIGPPEAVSRGLEVAERVGSAAVAEFAERNDLEVLSPTDAEEYHEDERESETASGD